MTSHGDQGAMQNLQDAAKVLLMLRAEMAQREARMSASISEQVQALRQEVGLSRRDITGIVGGASSQIAKEAREAVAPVVADYGRAVLASSGHLQAASRTVLLWFGAAGATLVLVLLVAWVLLGYYRRELSTVKDELQRYEDAVPVLQAFYASDAVICDGRVCVNVDPKGQRAGDKKQHRQAKPRPQP